VYNIVNEPICRYTFDTHQLVTDFPPDLRNARKQLVYRIACPPGCVHKGCLEFSRWPAFPLPVSFSVEGVPTEIEAREDVFDYELPPENNGVVEWHLNFADAELFCAYGSSLLAQDELQVAEHPALGSLREALLHAHIFPLTEEHGNPTPILIRGVERRCAIATESNTALGRPHGLYGNNFARASVEAIRQATTPLHPPTVTNLIAMTAPSGRAGVYRLHDIQHILRTAFTGFSAARLESIQGHTQPLSMIVHTGFWGCGAFGGNRILMALLQCLAAHVSRVDRLVFHSFDRAGSEALTMARQILEQQLLSQGEQYEIQELLGKIHAMKFRWGVSDGN
jgi:hypothetical protein